MSPAKREGEMPWFLEVLSFKGFHEPSLCHSAGQESVLATHLCKPGKSFPLRVSNQLGMAAHLKVCFAGLLVRYEWFPSN